MSRTVIIWFRNDLRLHDHEALKAALDQEATALPVYVFDPRFFGRTRAGFERTAAFRARFLLESVADLRQSLRRLGSELIVRVGQPEMLLPEIARIAAAEAVHFHYEAGTEEREIEKRVEEALKAEGVAAVGFQGRSLLHPKNLPFGVTQLPDLFIDFRRRIESNTPIRQPFPAPLSLPNVAAHGLEAGDLPALETLGVADRPADPRGFSFKGGETAALARLQDYFWTKDRLRHYKATRNGLLGDDFSSRFSPWLSAGCLSPRRVYAEVERYENQVARNDSTHWLIFELLWRDYFHFLALKHGGRLFQRNGLRRLRIEWQRDAGLFAAWQEGRTGYPLVDAGMRELAATGWLSNRGRQVAASFLTKNLGVDWLWGAQWFESLLIDYDPASNYGNWSYAAAVGVDPRGFRFFNPLKQGHEHDPNGDYVRHWLPELARVPANRVHELWKLSPEERKKHGVGADYPLPVVDLFASAEENEKRYELALVQAGLRRARHNSRIRQFVKK